MIFVVSNDLKSVDKASEESFSALNLWERQHIEEWIRKAPDILGEDLLVVNVQFDHFNGSQDRLDILAVDRQGNLVVVELKRDPYAGYAELQAVRYAAMVSAMTVDKLFPYYLDYLKKNGHSDATPESARSQLIEFVEAEDFKELSSRPRIILCSEDFSQEITATVLWLRQFGLDISCIRFTPYRVRGNIVIVPRKIIPLQRAEQYQIDIQKKQEETVSVGQGRKRKRTLDILLENGLIKGGEKIYLKNALPAHVKYREGDPIFTATLTGKPGAKNSVQWDKDGKEYAISSLTWEIFRALHPERKDPGGVNGNLHWEMKDGRNLWDVAEEFLGSVEPAQLGMNGQAANSE